MMQPMKVSRGSLFLFSGGGLEERVVELLEPIAAELGVEVLAVHLHGQGRRQRLRVIIDRAGGVDADVLERLSRALSLQLDVEDLIAGRYVLEVTSPGLDWPLTTPADFQRHVGEMLRIRLQDGGELIGKNLGLADDGLDMRLQDGSRRHIGLGEIVRAVRVIDWHGKRSQKNK